MKRRPVRRNYSRMARLNELLREVLADAIEVEVGSDGRLEMLTVTAVDCDPDLRHARVYFSSLPAPAAEALARIRPRLQAAIARQVRAKRTPQLAFDADPAVAYGERVDSVLRQLRAEGQSLVGDDQDNQPAEGEPSSASPYKDVPSRTEG